MGRRRSRQNNPLPPNLYPTKRWGKTYYRYRHPQTGQFHGMGGDRKRAIEAAKQLNDLLSLGRDLVAKVQGGGRTFGEYIQHFKDEVLPARRVKGEPLSPHTLRDYGWILDAIAEELGYLPIEHVTQKHLSDYLQQRPSAEAFNRHRTLMVMVYRQAVSDGLVKENLPERIMKRDRQKKVRQRLSLEDYKRAFAHARPAIRVAMELSLNALQRRSDIYKWRFDDQKVDPDSGEEYAHIIQSKTRKHGPTAYLRIPLSLPTVHSELRAQTLGDLIAACRDDIACPFLVHERPRRMVRSKEKEHPFQLTPRAISDGFVEARDTAGVMSNLGPAARPTFHELLSLGEHLRKEAGWSTKQLQVLRGHTSERMTEHYLEGHTWTTVEVPNER